MKIIAFTAKKETGKTTAVKYMMQKYPNAVQINFKDALVEELKLYFPELLQAICDIYEKLDYDGMDPWTVEKLFRVKPPLVRALMRNFGTEVRRKESPHYWVTRWKTKMSMLDPRATHVFVDDVRFLNEAEAVKELGGTIIKITSDKPVPEDAHTSESEMGQIVPDKTVRNFFGEVEVLYKQLDEIK
jgi:hypothetical protein